jgi:hypothetical protein
MTMPEPEASWLPLSGAALLMKLPEEVVLYLALMGELEGRMHRDREEVSCQSVERWLLLQEHAPNGLALTFHHGTPAAKEIAEVLYAERLRERRRLAVRRWENGRLLPPEP